MSLSREDAIALLRKHEPESLYFGYVLENRIIAAIMEAGAAPIPRQPTVPMTNAGEKKRKEIMGRGESINVIWKAMYDAYLTTPKAVEPAPAAPRSEDAELPLRSMSTHLLTATQLTGAELIHIANALDKVADRIAALSAQVAAGEADRRQLDWLDRDDISIEFAVDPDTGKSIVSIDSLGTRSKELACENTLREAIDTAIASSAAQRKGEPWPAT